MRNEPETEMGGADRRFPKTSWSILVQLQDRESLAYRKALERLLGLYWKPVYCLIRHAWGKSNEDAKDLTQDFFSAAVLEGSLVEKFAPERGSFRAFLKASVMNFLRDDAKAAGRQKRGGDVRTLSLQMEDFDLADAIPDTRSLTPEQLFDAAWRNFVLARAIELVEERLRADGKQAWFEVFRRYDLEAGSVETSYRNVGETLGLTPDTVKNHLTRARQEFRNAVSDVMCETVESEASPRPTWPGRCGSCSGPSTTTR